MTTIYIDEPTLNLFLVAYTCLVLGAWIYAIAIIRRLEKIEKDIAKKSGFEIMNTENLNITWPMTEEEKAHIKTMEDNQ